MEMEKREQQLVTFKNFISDTHSFVDEILSSVGWNREFLQKESREMVFCPFNTEHRMPKYSLEHHIQSCAWRKEGYHDLDLPLPQLVTKDSETSIILDSSNIASIIRKAKRENDFLVTGDVDLEERPIPKTSDRLMSEYTTDERRILYDHVIANTRAPGDVTVADVQLIGDMKKDDAPRPKSKLELLIEQRDAKRRRISYRKKVHTNRKTQTEILREVIQNQMELVEQIIKGECDDENDKDSIGESGDHRDGDHRFGDDVKSEPTEGESVGSFGREKKSFHESERKSDREYRLTHRESSRNPSHYGRSRRDEVNYRSDRSQSYIHSDNREERDRWSSEKHYSKPSSHRVDRHKDDRQKWRDREHYDDYAHGGRRDYHSRSYSRSSQEKGKNYKEGHRSKPSRSEHMTSDCGEEIEEQYHRKHKKSRHLDEGDVDSHHDERLSYSEYDIKNSTPADGRSITEEVYHSHETVYGSEKHKKKSKKSKKKKSHKHKSKSKSKKKSDSGSVISKSSSVDSNSEGNELFSA